jgi:hypothetical protein
VGQVDFRLSFQRFPIESVLLTVVADELLRVFLYALVILRDVLALSASAIAASSLAPIHRDKILSLPAARRPRSRVRQMFLGRPPALDFSGNIDEELRHVRKVIDERPLMLPLGG